MSKIKNSVLDHYGANSSNSSNLEQLALKGLICCTASGTCCVQVFWRAVWPCVHILPTVGGLSDDTSTASDAQCSRNLCPRRDHHSRSS